MTRSFEGGVGRAQDHARRITFFSLSQATGYILSGCAQPVLVQILRTAGLADARAQLYMWFYYLGPALVLVPFFFHKPAGETQGRLMAQRHSDFTSAADGSPWPSRTLILRAIGISLFDTVSASMNYAGASLSGPTVFAIIYSSVTIWTAVFSRILLGRRISRYQALSIGVVFFGLAITATESQQLGSSVWIGCLLILIGSSMHAMTYVLCEAIMTVGNETLTLAQNCGIQASTACVVLGIWQLVYTLPNWKERIQEPMDLAGTSAWWALLLLVLFAFCNWVHSITFYETLIHFPGGATSAGVMKGLQAVLVFVVTDVAFCGITGGKELCFTRAKGLSLVMVVTGVTAYGTATQHQQEPAASRSASGEYSDIETDDPDGDLEEVEA